MTATESIHVNERDRPHSRRLAVLDREQSGWWVAEPDREEWFSSTDALLDGTLLDQLTSRGVTHVVIELAHLHPRRGRSVAQVYTQAELEKLYAVTLERNVTIVAFPSTLTFRAILELSGRKRGKPGDANELRDGDYQQQAARSILRHLELYPRTFAACPTWQPLTPAKEALLDARDAIRQDVNTRLNVMRPAYAANDPDVAGALAALSTRLPASPDRELIERCFGFTYYKTSRHQPAVAVIGDRELQHLGRPQVMALYVATVNEDGSARTTTDGHFIGVDSVCRALKLSAFHSHAGVARSNLWWHRERLREKKAGLSYTDLAAEGDTSDAAQAQRQAKRALRTPLRTEYQRACRALIRLFRDHALVTATGSIRTDEYDRPDSRHERG